MNECEGQFGTIIRCNLDAKFIIILNGRERYACRYCKKNHTVVKRL